MKKTFILALAAIVVMAFASCGGNSSKKANSNGENTEVEATDTPVKLDGKGSQQFQECKAVYAEMEKDLKKAKTCEELKATLISSIEKLPLFKDFPEGETMTEAEFAKLEEIADGVKEKYDKLETKLCK
jgi:uncharacterized lipoprotein YehR (DUF1307 family)